MTSWEPGRISPTQRKDETLRSEKRMDSFTQSQPEYPYLQDISQSSTGWEQLSKAMATLALHSFPWLCS